MLFAGFADQEANTFQGRLDRLNVAFDEAKETVGFALLPVLEKRRDRTLISLNCLKNVIFKYILVFFRVFFRKYTSRILVFLTKNPSRKSEK